MFSETHFLSRPPILLTRPRKAAGPASGAAREGREPRGAQGRPVPRGLRAAEGTSSSGARGRGEDAAGREKRDSAQEPTSQSFLTTRPRGPAPARPGRVRPAGTVTVAACVLHSWSGGKGGGQSRVREGAGRSDGGGGKKEGRL
ncbi:hypothetical protein HJG60_011408 [Phyllostomus discolor]|uniref:Uncharacterized protein n=1 Tax=Phyllostomus discolor TaxID=89673 RepID=A0A833ZXR0_9CHIR|nr:hypothetical protein HJG60_011408 [Phyllostomus discolor]